MRRSRTLALGTLGAALLLAGVCATRRDAERPRALAQLRGTLVSAETTFSGMRGRYAGYRVKLVSSSGLVATGRLLRPGRPEALPDAAQRGQRGHRHAAALLNDGRELNSAALEYLPPEFGDVVVLSLDYPAEIPYEIHISTLLFRGDQMRGWARRISASFSLGAEYLAARSDVDSSRLAIVATSFAVPFAVAAAARDERFRSVGLIYGAGDFARVLEANLRLRPAALRRLVAWLVTRPLRELEPERLVGRIAPRPLVMVNGVDDPQMPREAVEALYDAAREPKTIVWMRTGHLMPTDSALIRVLVDTTLARMPMLGGSPQSSNR
ncbi:MAG: alpha/beta hydrolase family protein [Gemmatimonadaceae bacterium]